MQAFKTFISVLLTLLIMIMLYVLFILGNISSFFSSDNIQKAVSNIDVTHEISKMKNSSLTAGGKAEIIDIVDTAYEEAKNHGISTQLVDEMFNSKEVKMFLGKAVGNTTDYVINNKKEKKLMSDDFNKILDENIDKWLQKADIQISDSKKEVLLIRMKEASKGIIDTLPSEEVINNKVDDSILNKIRLIFSSEVRVGLVIAISMMLILLFFLKKREAKWLVYLAMAALIAGLVTIATGFMINDILDLVLKEYNLSFMMNSFSVTFAHNIFITGAVSSVIALLIFLVHMIIQKRKISA